MQSHYRPLTTLLKAGELMGELYRTGFPEVKLPVVGECPHYYSKQTYRSSFNTVTIVCVGTKVKGNFITAQWALCQGLRVLYMAKCIPFSKHQQ